MGRKIDLDFFKEAWLSGIKIPLISRAMGLHYDTCVKLARRLGLTTRKKPKRPVSYKRGPYMKHDWWDDPEDKVDYKSMDDAFAQAMKGARK